MGAAGFMGNDNESINTSCRRKMLNNIRPLVSVALTTHNRAHLLSRCLNSILSQSYKNLEVIVIDDCSSDNTAALVKEYQEKDQRVQFYRHEINKKNAHARNTALENCNGYYVAFMDDDDEWIDENKIEKQINIFENSNDDKLGIVCSSVRIYSSKSAYEEKIIQKPINLITTILKGNSYIYNSTVITKRDIMICVGGFDVNLPRGVDSDFYRRCIINLGCSAHFMQEVTTGVHEYGEDRMTPTDSAISLKKDIVSNEMCLQKFSHCFKVHHQEKMIRKKAILKKYLKLMRMTKDFRLFSKIIRLIWI